MKTTIDISIIVRQPGTAAPIRTFVQHCTSENTDDAQTLWIGTVTGLELVMSKMHRELFPTPEELQAAARASVEENADKETVKVATHEFSQALAGLMEIVEGVRSVRWNHEGHRLKDTPEWCRFYVAAKSLDRLTTSPTTPGDDAIATGGSQ